MMDSKEDFERGSSGDGAGAVVIAGEFPSDLSEGIIAPPPPRAWAYRTDGDAAKSPPDNVDQDAALPPASAVITASTTLSGLADAGAPPTELAGVAHADLSGLLLTRAAVLLNAAKADAIVAASRRAPPPPGKVKPGRSLPPAAVGSRRPSDDSPPLTTSTARPFPRTKRALAGQITTRGMMVTKKRKGRRAMRMKLRVRQRWWRLHLKRQSRNSSIMMTMPQLHQDGLLHCSEGTATKRRNGRNARRTKLHVRQI
jgi:hypothetical protein